MKIFDKIDNADKAYFLGLLWADGSITSRRRGSYTEIRLQISLVEEDGYIIKKLCNLLKIPTERVKKYIPKKSNEKPYYKLYFARKHITEDLYPFRTKEIFHKVPKALYWHFLRGLFDGDGSVYINTINNKFRYGQWSIVTHERELFIFDRLLSTLNLSIVYDKRTEGLCSITTNKQSSLQTIFTRLYENKNDLYLKRKYDKFKSIMNNIQNSSTTIPDVGVGSSDPKREASVKDTDEDMVSSHVKA